MPKRGSGEKARATRVHARNNPRGIETRGHRRGNPERSSAAKASASRIWDTAIERRIATAEADASQKGSFFRNGEGTNIRVSRMQRYGRDPHFVFATTLRHGVRWV